ncbi:beta-N-acetylhexosaminidase [Algoriphagus limi]|uniref:beta-N-acetylhexosaminidase n=1 Tax=Algoriphagus limi TaxID=2975273 RepID=A0ABT2G484_9BACT|nr:beta-N-acetylhexosaminidase [Algoriphagus limi]MCS5489578.1 beta-N-acetylhexosaminidase [Algoriphagus limi]
MKKFNVIIALIFSSFIYSCQPSGPALEDRGIIPIPSQVSSSNGTFELMSSSAIQLVGDQASLSPIATYFADQVSQSTGFDIQVAETGNLVFELTGNNPSDESYQLEIEKEQVKITANSPAGIFYGVQTLLQVFPAEILSNERKSVAWLAPTGSITDSPEYGYRGAMLDVARHFIGMEDVKHFIDQMAHLKLNHFHLHLTDDQGWRIEIKSWPRLTEIGGSTEVGGGESGFFTQEDYQEIVRYAAERFITIVPEIDMPGHTNAALASYGELNPGINLPDGDLSTVNKPVHGSEIDFSSKMIIREPAELYTGTEVGFSTFDTDLDLTYQFIDDVVRELSEITPGPYIHIGGDESHVTRKDDYVVFVEKVQEIVQKYGKTSIGWDEIATAKLLSGNIAQFWADEENAGLAVGQGNKILMSPAKKAYLDMQYDSTSRIGLHWAAYIELDSAYLWDPASYASGISKSDIFGVEAPLWTETVENRADIEYLVFPRLAALAEVAWSPASTRDWVSFQARIKELGKSWENQGIDFYRTSKVNW